MAKKKKEEKEPQVDDRDDMLAAYFKQAQKNYGKGAVQFAKDHRYKTVDRVTTGILGLDYSLGGGLPIGRVSMFYGPKSSSKTTCFLRAAGRAQRMCSNCWTPAFPIWTPLHTQRKPKCQCGDYRRTMIAWLDVEGVWDEKWSKKFLRLEDNTLVLSQPETGEQTADISDSLLRSGAVDIIVIDSVAFMTPVAEIEKSAADAVMAEQARLLGRYFRGMVSGINAMANKDGRRPTVWFTNQIRHKVGVMFGSPETVPGGFAQGFATSTETRMSPGKYKFDKEDEIGQPSSVLMKYRNEKNKTGKAKMAGEYTLVLSDTEVKKVGDILDEPYALKLGAAAGMISLGKGRAATVCDGVEYQGRSLLERHWMINPGEYEDFKSRLLDRLLDPAGIPVAAEEEQQAVP